MPGATECPRWPVKLSCGLWITAKLSTGGFWLRDKQKSWRRTLTGMTSLMTAGDDTPLPRQPRPTPPAQPGVPAQPDTSTCAPLRAGSPAELLAVIPQLLGFMPEASLVVIGTEPPDSSVKVTLRYDLPDPPGAGIAADMEIPMPVKTTLPADRMAEAAASKSSAPSPK